MGKELTGTHTLLVRFYPISKAIIRFFGLRRSTTEIVGGDNFNVVFTIRNLGDATFPGGEIRLLYRSPVHMHSAAVQIRKLEPGEEDKTEPRGFVAVGVGDAGVFCEIVSNDSNPVECAGEGTPGISKCVGYSNGDPDKPQFWFPIVPKEALDSRRKQIVIIIISAISAIAALTMLCMLLIN